MAVTSNLNLTPMKKIAENNLVIEFLSGPNSLISSKLKGVNIYLSDDALIIELKISLLYSKQYNDIVIQFHDVSEYSFFYQNSSNFYFIEAIKFLKADNTFYMSLDPYDESEIEINKSDNDYIYSKNVYLFEAKNN